MGAQISAITALCAHLNGERAKAIHDHFLQAGVRVEAGDKALYSVIEQNCERVDRAAADGDILAVALQGTRRAEPREEGEGLPWAKEWNSNRALQMVSNSRVIKNCREHSVNAPTIQNMLNQAPLGFTCSTKRFKQDNGIPQSTPVPEYMTSSQLALRRMAQKALLIDIENGNLTSAQAERRMREIRDMTTGFAQYMHEGGLRKLPSGGSFGRAAVAIEASHQKMTRRQLKIERKEIAAQQIEREDDATISF